MRNLQPAIMAVLLGTCALAPLPTPSFAQTCTCVSPGIHADAAPPPLPEYDQPPIPVPGYLWTPGYWSWNNEDYYWVPGTWVEPPQPGLLWTPGYWAFNDGVYAFSRGYWGARVGFYGGISYGFGYSGEGYEGGHWDNGQFFYNRTVNNIGRAHITNVYNKTIIVNNVTINHASYNGGADGTRAKATPEEEAAAKEQHVPPTKLQIDHARAASRNDDLFSSTNHGKPKVAATARPAEFKGPGVVPASAAGVAQPVAPEPGVNAEPKAQEKPSREKPSSEKPVEKPAPAEKSDIEKKGLEAAPVAKPEPAKAGAPKAEEKRLDEKPKEKPPAAEKSNLEKKAPEAAPMAKPEPAKTGEPKVEEKRLDEKPREKPAAAEKNNIEKKAPEHAPKVPEKQECGRPGLPPCPK
jgi:hypothetical protein